MIAPCEQWGKAKQESTAKNTHVVMSQDGLSKQKETSIISSRLLEKKFQSSVPPVDSSI